MQAKLDQESKNNTVTFSQLHRANMRVTVSPTDQLSRLPNELKYEITRRLSLDDLNKLGRCSKVWINFIKPLLFLKDSSENDSSAILWAANSYPDEVEQHLALQTVKLSIQYKGDVNAVYFANDISFGTTALSVAAAHGKSQMVELLLQHGADYRRCSENLCFLPVMRLEHKTINAKLVTYGRELALESSHGLWSPLFVPFVMGYDDTVAVLEKAGASGELIVEKEPQNNWAGSTPAITILHLLAADEKCRSVDFAGECYFEKHAALLNTRSIGLEESPLHVALRRLNIDTFNKILRFGADLEAVTQLGRTALLQAVVYCYKTRNRKKRQEYHELIEKLIVAGANVNAHSALVVSQTPLTATITAAPNDWKHIYRDMKTIIKLLMDSGADINERSPAGHTLIHLLCHNIHIKKGSESLQDLLTYLVSKRGGDINLPLPGGISLLTRYMVEFDDSPPQFIRTLLELGAEIMPDEAGPVLLKWARCSKLQKVYNFDLARYKNHIHRDIVDRTFRLAFRGDMELFKQLQAHFPAFKAEFLLAEAIESNDNHSKKLALALDLDFDGAYYDHHGNNFLHLIVHKFENCATYKERDALEDAQIMVKQGAKICHENTNGLTVLQRLRRSARPCPNLRLYLYEVYEDHTRFHTPCGEN